MHVRVVRPEQLSPDDLDDYLARGWFRIGQAMMTCRVVQFDGELRPAIWTRLPLRGHAFRKNSRKLLARNTRDFRVEVGGAKIDDEREALYQRYLSVARGERSPTLVDFLYGDSERDVFDTQEISLWDVDRLVAFSWFDRGRRSVQSLIGVYEPELERRSLGFTTMLLEVDVAQDRGLEWHYPGYVLPGDAAMDYKLRIGDVEFLDPWHQDWRPIPELEALPLPTDRLEQALRDVRDALVRAGISAELRRYAWFEAPAWQTDLAACLDQPLVVECYPERAGSTLLLVTHDVDRDQFSIVRALRARAVTRGRSEVEVPIELWLVAERLCSRKSAEATATEVARRTGLALPARGTG